MKPVHPLVQKVRSAKPPIAELIGFTVEEMADGRAVGILQAGPQHSNPMGTMHGGVLCDVADAAMSMAFVSTLEPDESFTTIELGIHFFRPVWTSLLTAEARGESREEHGLRGVRGDGSGREARRQGDVDLHRAPR